MEYLLLRTYLIQFLFLITSVDKKNRRFSIRLNNPDHTTIRFSLKHGKLSRTHRPLYIDRFVSFSEYEIDERSKLSVGGRSNGERNIVKTEKYRAFSRPDGYAIETCNLCAVEWNRIRRFGYHG